jgi:hypothetical protein
MKHDTKALNHELKRGDNGNNNGKDLINESLRE